MTEVEDVTDAKPISAAVYSTLIKIEDPRPMAEKFPYTARCQARNVLMPSARVTPLPWRSL